MKLATIGYLPPAKLVYAQTFLENLKDWPAKHRMILFTDQDWKWDGELIRLKNEVETVGRNNQFAISNLLWLTSVRIAIAEGITHFLYLEADCRIAGQDWDDRIFTEFFATNGGRGEELSCGGSVNCYGISNVNGAFLEKSIDFLIANRNKPPIGVYGQGGASQTGPARILVNGALAVFNVRWMQQLFPEGFEGCVGKAQKMTAWDFEIGRRLFNELGADVFDNIAHLGSVYSAYGNVISTEDDRKGMLESGEVVGVHQIETAWKPSMEAQPLGLPRAEQMVAVEVAPTVAEPVAIQRVKGTNHPSTCIFIVSYAKDLAWLRWCLRSIKKFATGFKDTVVMWPEHQKGLLKDLREEFPWVTFNRFQEAVGKGHLHHMAIKCSADHYTPDEWILHMDSDCVFSEPVTPSDYFVDGKPVMLVEPYSNLVGKPRHVWKEPTEKALGFVTPFETMCRHPAVHHRSTYYDLRDWIETHHGEGFGKAFTAYVLEQKADFPYGFCEFNALGGYVMEKYPSRYHILRVDKGERPPDKVKQFWSGSPPTVRFKASTNLGLLDPTTEGTPANYFKKVLGL